jgi:hypothetical protein
MTVFVDTSALFAVLDSDDAHHPLPVRPGRNYWSEGEIS